MNPSGTIVKKGADFMKKLFCFCLAIIMLVSLCGCFSSNTDGVRGTISNKDNEPEFSMGKASGSTYNNDFLGLSFALPEGWVFYTDKQILEMNNLSGEYLDESVAEQLKNATIIYDMYANCQEDGSNVNINLEKLNAVQLANLNIQATLEAQIDSIISTYENMGFTDTRVVYQKTTVDGKEFDGLRLTAKIYGADFFGTIFAFKKGNYLANVAVCTMQTDKTASVLDCFTVK